MMKLLFAVLDANVLYPQVLRDVLLSLSFNGVYAARWSDRIHDEWTRNLQKQRPDLLTAQLQRTRRLMNEQIEDSLVENYEHLIPTLELPDADDRHVLAAAIHSQSEIIVTWNLKDFPRRALEEHGIIAVSPDQFLSERLAEKTALVIAALAEQRQRMRNPPQSPAQFLESLQRQKLTRFVAALWAHEDEL